MKPWGKSADSTTPRQFMDGAFPVVPWFVRIQPWGRYSWSLTLTNGVIAITPNTFVLGSRARAQRVAERMVRRQVRLDERAKRVTA